MATSSSTKPAILFVHGAWHRPVHYKGITDLLREHYDVVEPANLSAGGETTVGVTHHDDAAHLRDAMKPFLDAGREIVVVAHSYGGLPSTEAVAGNTVAERKAQGLQGGVKALVYIAALVLFAKDINAMDDLHLRANLPDWYGIKDGLMVTEENAGHVFYSDLSGKDDAEIARLYGSTVHQSLASFESKSVAAAAELQTKLVYVKCEKDVCVVPPLQDLIVGGLGEKCKTVSFETGHSPFILKDYAVKLFDVIKDAAEGEA